MSEQRRKRKGGGKKRGVSKGKEFMDAAIDAFIRAQALHLWRDFVIYRERQEMAVPEALAQTGFFGDKAEYEPLWLEHWRREVLAKPGQSDGEQFAQIETAVRSAVLEEKALRIERGGATLEDTDDYNAFVRHAMNQLVADAGASNET